MQKMERGYDPLREEVHWTLISSSIASALWIAAFLYGTTQDLPALSYTADSLWGFLLPIGLAVVVLPGADVAIFLILRHARARILPLRTSALTGTAPISLSPQPEVAPLPVTLPHTIHMHINKGFLLWPAIIIAISLVFFSFVFFSSLPEGASMQFRLISSMISYPLIPLLSPIITLFQSRWTAPMLTLDEESVTARYGGDSVTIRWADVRSFAIMGKNKPDSQVVFELSDGRHIIRWLDAFTVRRAKTYVPNMKREDYTALLQALPPWICARTGQPLRDLRM